MLVEQNLVNIGSSRTYDHNNVLQTGFNITKVYLQNSHELD